MGEPEIAEWRDKDYKAQDTDGELRFLANGKSDGSDGIPGESYKDTRARAIRPIIRVTDDINAGTEIPPIWTNGSIVYKKNAVTTDQYA